MSVPAGSTPLATAFEEYAANQEQWYDDFVDVLEKMLSNGYDANSFVDTPDHETNIICPKWPNMWDGNRFYNCFHDLKGISKSNIWIISI